MPDAAPGPFDRRHDGTLRCADRARHETSKPPATRTGVDRAPRHVVVFLAALSPLLFLAASAALTAPGTASAAAPSAAHVDPTSSWTVYHGNAIGSGVDTSGVTFSPATPAWQSPVLDGQVYGEPLESGGRVYVATENDTVYALAANTGAVLWSTNVGPAVPSSDLPCGDIGPQVGITGTPVIDVGRGEIFAVADELIDGAPAHMLVGVNMYSGAQELNQDVDPPGSSPAHLLQRTGLNLDDGNVIFGFGGNDGDWRLTTAGSSRSPRAAAPPRSTTRRGPPPTAPKGPYGREERHPRSTRRATSGRRRATGRRRTPTTAAIRSSSSHPSWR